MKNNVHFFSQNEYSNKEKILEVIGIRGRQAMELAALDLPILPGFVIDSEAVEQLDRIPLRKNLTGFFAKLEAGTGKTYGDPQNPMLLKIVISPNLVITQYPTLHNFGLTDETLAGFISNVGENFGYHEMQYLVRGMLDIEKRIAELEKREEDLKGIVAAIAGLDHELKAKLTAAQRKTSLEKYLSLLPSDFCKDAYTQIEIALGRICRMLQLDEMNNNDTALLIQPMVYGNYGKDSSSGSFFTRNIVTGDSAIQGQFYQSSFDAIGAAGKEINLIGRNESKLLDKIARQVEDHFKDVRSIRFTIENKKLWLIDQRPVMDKSTQSVIRTLLDLYKRKIVDARYVIGQVKPAQLNEILHPVINPGSVGKIKCLRGGITGAPGAAIGRVYFTTETLLDAYREAQQKGEDTHLILTMPATFAEDVKAIEVATGVLSTEGGYSAHASVVARQYGKVSLVKPEMRIRGKKATIGDVTINEGDVVTLNVPFYGEPSIYLGKAELIEPNPEDSGMLEFIGLVRQFITGFHVRVNADTPREAALARTFGADGIGLCRTEHMFFDEKRINIFREMILADSLQERKEALDRLLPIQKSDFYKLFKIMTGKEVTIRLLDAPLHEFLPHNDDEMKKFFAYMNNGGRKKKLAEKEIISRCEGLNEFNPMLGHRGCRIAVSYPEIYEMQVQAIFEAVYTLAKEGVEIHPEIMIPLIMNADELKLIIYGKKIEGKSISGLVEAEQAVRQKMKADPMPYRVGTMIELPVAALGAGQIARYAEFFSFGTNDLTQTTIGLSRDDFNTFMPDYTQFDILDGNPFRFLNEHVKELIQIAVKRGHMTRPSLQTGLCGEHGAMPDNIKFCMDAGLNYVSCSVYSVPIALLAVAQLEIERSKTPAGKSPAGARA